MNPDRKITAAEVGGLLAVLALTAALYWPTLDGGFHFDDLSHVVNNPAVRLESLSPAALARAGAGPLRNRPLAYLSFALDYRRAGLDPRAFHLTNLGLHLAAVAAAWLFLRALLSAPALAAPRPRATALALATVFGLHPVQFQTVAYVVQRMNLIAGLCSLAALGFWLAGRDATGPRRVVFFLGAAASAALGLAGKETTIALALLVPAADLCLSGLELRPWLSRRKPWIAAGAGAAVIVGAVFFVGGKGLEGYQSRDFSPAERLLTQPRVVLWYASAWAFPAPQRLSLEHDWPVSRSPFRPWTTLPALLALGALTAAALSRSRRAPLLCLGWLWFVGGLALESSVLPLEMVFEHRLYLPGIGLGLCGADLLGRVRFGRASAVAALALVVVFSAASFARGRDWRNELEVWRDAVSKSPGSSRAWSNLCAFHFSYGDGARAASACAVATRLHPGNADAWFNLGLARLGRGDFEPAETAFSRALAERPDWAEAFYQRGRTRARLGRPSAEADLARATMLEPSDPVFWYQLAAARFAQHKDEAGREALDQARANLVNADPDSRPELEQAIRLLEPAPSPDPAGTLSPRPGPTP